LTSRESLEDFATNLDLALKFVAINPTTSETGLELLCWEYTYYERVLNEN